MKIWNEIRVLVVLLVVLGVTVLGFSHGGRTNAHGCHNNRKTDVYHCHGPKTNLTIPVNEVEWKDTILADSIDAQAVDKANDAGACCKVCKKGKACGNSCIARWKTCSKGVGCACDG